MKKLLLILFSIPLILTSCYVNEVVSPDPEPEDSSVVVTPPDSDTTHIDTTIVVVPPEPNDTARNLGYLFDISDVPVITIEVAEADWNTYLANMDANMNNRQYVLASFTMQKGDGKIFYRDSVGLRPRGNTSRRRPEGDYGMSHNKYNPDWHHAHFGVKFTEYKTGQRFFGMDRVVLKWFNNDPSYCREVYCYDLFRRFGVWSSPRASYCRLYIQIKGDDKPAYFGVYEMIEGVRKGYLADRRKDGFIPDSDGNLWKAAYNSQGPADLFNTDKSRMGVADDYHDYAYALKSNKTNGLSAAQTELVDFINGMMPLPSGSQQLKDWLAEHMDVDLFLRQLAVNVMVGMWDDYWINGNNYYFYFDSNHRFYFIPYDYDNTLGTSSIIRDSGTQDLLHWGSRDGDRLLVKKVLSIAEYENTYKNYIKQLAQSDELFGEQGSMARIRAFHQMIAPFVANDTGEDMQISDQPAGWGNKPDYRLLSGNSGINFFKTKINSINF